MLDHYDNLHGVRRCVALYEDIIQRTMRPSGCEQEIEQPDPGHPPSSCLAPSRVQAG